MKAIQRIKFIFLISFLLALYLPVITFDWISKESKEEKRNLAKLPVPFKNRFHLNFKFFSQFDKFIGDRFGLRKYFVMFNANIKYKILKVKGTNFVLIGKKGWLYWLYYMSKIDNLNNIDDFMKNNLLDKNSLDKAVTSLKNRAEWCRKNNIKFIFLNMS